MLSLVRSSKVATLFGPTRVERDRSPKAQHVTLSDSTNHVLTPHTLLGSTTKGRHKQAQCCDGHVIETTSPITSPSASRQEATSAALCRRSGKQDSRC
jgi:hypothetical protein